MQASTAGKETLALPAPAHATEAEARQGCCSILEAFLPGKFFQIGHTRVRVGEVYSASGGGTGREWRDVEMRKGRNGCALCFFIFIFFILFYFL